MKRWSIKAVSDYISKISILILYVLTLSKPVFASSHLFYLEAQGVIGYSSAQDKMIFYSLAQEEAMQKPSLGFDYLQKFSTESRDVASVAIQGRLALDPEGKRSFEPQLYNGFLKLKVRLVDLWLGHNRPALGLSSYFDSHGLLLTTLAMQGFGFDRDWGMGIYRDLSWGNFSFSITSGTGMPLEFKGNHLVAGRMSYGVLVRDNHNWGFSLAYGDVLETMGYHLMNPEPVTLRLVGTDFTYLWNNFENRFEIFAGEKMKEPSYALFYRVGMNLLSEGRLKVEAQPVYWKVGTNENYQLSWGISFQATADLAIRAGYTYEHPQKEHRVGLQIYYYRRT
jgi:hypothetical protein